MLKTKVKKDLKQEKNLTRKNKGITLIALVVTIIVLLILAGISIQMLTGENGILKRAIDAKEQTEKASEEEQRQLTIAEATMNLNGTKYKSTYKREEVTVPIPAGFAVSQVDGENTVEDGLVVIDSEGNEFVWIPVKNENEYKRNTTYEDTRVSGAAKDDENYLPDGIDTSGGEGNKEKEIVTKAGGFYISRFEAGKEDTDILVSKKDATVWASIIQEKCKEKSKEFIKNADVKSGLITGTQWDMVMKFVNNKKDGNGNIFNVTKINDSRHTRSVAKSGQNPADKVCNIYDLEGNYNELVAEKHSYDFGNGHYYVIRGGYYERDWNPSACVRVENSGIGGAGTSFRFVLYVI